MHRAVPLLLSMVLLAGCSAPAAVDEAPEPPQAGAAFDLALTSCREVLALFAVTMEHARGFVPANYTPLAGASGRAVAFSALKVCEDVAIDGESVGTASTVDSGVFLDAPDGSDGFHYYQTWWLTDSSALASRLVAMGWNASHVATNTLDGPNPTPNVGEVEARVEWAAGAYALNAYVTAAPQGTAPHAVGWYDGANGTVRVVKDLPGDTFGAGPVTFTGEGDMAALVGGNGSTGSALYSVYDLTGRVEPVA